MSEFVKALIEETREIRQGDLSPEEFSEIYDTIHTDCNRLGKASRLYFVLGNYDEPAGQRQRVEEVRDYISEYPEFEGFLMDEVDPDTEVWDNFYYKFCVFKSRADHLVTVVEDSDGGHELEVGEADTGRLRVLKRDYYNSDGSEDTETEHARYDGMLAHKFEELEQMGRLYRWTLHESEECDDLDRATRRVVEDTR